MAPVPRLLVLDPAIIRPEEEGVAEVLGDWTGDAVVLRIALGPDPLPVPGDLGGADGIVLMGSGASVHEDRPWLAPLARWLEPLLDGALPVPLLGICFGHQFIAHAAGGTVEFVHADRSPVRSVVRSAGAGSRLCPAPASRAVAASHAERVARVPNGYVVTAWRPESPVDALEHARLPVFSVQFHPEAREGFLTRRQIDPGPHRDAFLEDGRRLLAAFRSFVLAWRRDRLQ